MTTISDFSSCEAVDHPCKVFSAGKWRRDADVYSDQDRAEELNSLSQEERQRINEELHGVSEEINETPELRSNSLAELREILDRPPDRRHNHRKAFDRAFFLRPSFRNDDDFLLMFLRAKRFDAFYAALLIFAYFEMKLLLFGEEVLLRKIMIEDLTAKEVQLVRSGANHFLLSGEKTGRGISYSKLTAWDLSDWKSLIRSIWYINTCIQDNPNVQRKGMILVVDLCGRSQHSPAEILNFIAKSRNLQNTYLCRIEGVHFLYDNPALHPFFQGLLGVMNKDFRLRHRFHFGSLMEIHYSLLTFGINIHEFTQTGSGGSSPESMDKYLFDREKIDGPIRDREAPYRDPSSKYALYPNPNDVLLGRNLMVRASFSGNQLYKKIIESQASLFPSIDCQHKAEKGRMANETRLMLQRNYGTRFLARNEQGWIAATKEEVNKKVGQDLRTAAKKRLESSNYMDGP